MEVSKDGDSGPGSVASCIIQGVIGDGGRDDNGGWVGRGELQVSAMYALVNHSIGAGKLTV